jgi:methionyl aminopeptidase
LAKVALKALRQGIKRAKIGNRVGDISCAIQQFVEKNGFSVIRRFVGHGIGRSLHQLPEVPNFGTPAQGQQLFSGMALAIEPMVSSGTFEVEVALDGWTAKTKDGSLSAHFEDTVLVTERGPLVLTA